MPDCLICGVPAERHVCVECAQSRDADITAKVYPKPQIIKSPDFNSFVSFDIETTGLSYRRDSIIEIGAVKVIGGEIEEAEGLTFCRVIKPLYGKSVPLKITELTGITDEEAQAGDDIANALEEFLEFIGGLPLLGYNCAAFDSRFVLGMAVCCNTKRPNPYFDVLHYARKLKHKIGILDGKCSLANVSGKLEIINPRAHRALADALTTARVFLKLKEL